MAGRLHREPGEPVGVVIAVRELVEGACEPVARVGELRVKFRGYFSAYFVAGLADAWTKSSDNVIGFRTEFHLHVPKGFCSDAMNCAAPTRMNRSDRVALRICEQDGDAVGGLNHEEDARFARDESIALWSFLP